MPLRSQEERLAMLSWEASVERLRHALLPADGLPPRTTVEIDDCFNIAHLKLSELREAYSKRTG